MITGSFKGTYVIFSILTRHFVNKNNSKHT
jgi:hypothetical protein